MDGSGICGQRCAAFPRDTGTPLRLNAVSYDGQRDTVWPGRSSRNRKLGIRNDASCVEGVPRLMPLGRRIRLAKFWRRRRTISSACSFHGNPLLNEMGARSESKPNSFGRQSARAHRVACSASNAFIFDSPSVGTLQESSPVLTRLGAKAPHRSARCIEFGHKARYAFPPWLHRDLVRESGERYPPVN